MGHQRSSYQEIPALEHLHKMLIVHFGYLLSLLPTMNLTAAEVPGGGRRKPRAATAVGGADSRVRDCDGTCLRSQRKTARLKHRTLTVTKVKTIWINLANLAYFQVCNATLTCPLCRFMPQQKHLADNGFL